ncbi:MAG: PQQ-binding-like beta-propeller repeat protein, partial [Limisphaerales bacterium]
GSPKPNFLGMMHRGDNLFANCVVALDVRTGKRLWYFQEIRHDIWDLDVPAPPILTTITRDGKKVDVVAAVTKIGNTLLLDRVTGKPVFPFRMRRAPTSTLPGEITAAYQPDLDLPQPFARQEFKLTDASERTEEVRERVLDQLKSAQFGWFLPLSDRKVTVFYNVHGGAEWTGACADPTRGRLYVTANEVPWLMSLLVNDEPRFNPNAKPTHGEEIFRVTCVQCHGLDRMGIGVAPPLRGLRHRLKDADVVALLKTGRGLMPVAPPMSDADQQALLDFLFLRDRPAPKGPPVKPERPQFVQTGWNRFLDAEGYPACKPPWGTLNCIDLNSGRLLWKVPLGEHDELKKQGVPKTGTENFGGALVTAGGLVFAGGTRDEKLRAFDADTGEELWSVKLPWGASAPPAVYEVNGRQHVVIAATGGGKLGLPMGDAYVAFALPKQ